MRRLSIASLASIVWACAGCELVWGITDRELGATQDGGFDASSHETGAGGIEAGQDISDLGGQSGGDAGKDMALEAGGNGGEGGSAGTAGDGGEGGSAGTAGDGGGGETGSGDDGGLDAGTDSDSSAGGADASIDVASDANQDGPGQDDCSCQDVESLPTLSAWHRVKSPEPAGKTMRNPIVPSPGGAVEILFGVSTLSPAEGGMLHWWWSGESAPTTAAFTHLATEGGNDYWVASFQMPQHAVGTFRYYIEALPADPHAFATTFLYGDDNDSNPTSLESAARTLPFQPEVRMPYVGEVVVSEVMVNPNGTSMEPLSEWFEIYCAAPVPVTLNGCQIGDSTTAQVVSAPELILWPGVYATFGATSSVDNMEGFVPDYAYGTNWHFGNSPGAAGDGVRILLPDDTEIDSVTYNTNWSSAVYGTEGHSMQFKSSAPTAAENDLAGNWCASKRPYGTIPPYGTSDGTPNAPHDSCAPP